MSSTRTTVILTAALLVLCASTTVIASSQRVDHSLLYAESQHPPATHDFMFGRTHAGLPPCHETSAHALHVSHPCMAFAVHSTPLAHAPISRDHKPRTARGKTTADQHLSEDHPSHDDLARFDMSAYAAHHLGVVVGQEHTYGSTTEWSKGWSYRWMDFVHHGETVRVCHAMKNHDIHTRYVAVWDPAHFRWSHWEQMN